MPSKKIRLDQLLVELGHYPDTDSAARAILSGEVTSPEPADLKPGLLVLPGLPLDIKSSRRYASRGGEKLEHALLAFGIKAQGLACVDIGAGSGGFTDCLLAHGAKSVTAIDVGYGQFDWRLRQDPRVSLQERTNFRSMPPPPAASAFDLAVADLSFIRTSGLLGQIRAFLKPTGQMVVLVKPQFELGRSHAAELKAEAGIVTDPALHQEVLSHFCASARQAGFVVHGLIPSPLLGMQGNREFLFWASLAGIPATIDLSQVVRQ